MRNDYIVIKLLIILLIFKNIDQRDLKRIELTYYIIIIIKHTYTSIMSFYRYDNNFKQI